MGFILDIFGGKKTKKAVTIQAPTPDQTFTDSTTKLVGKPLPVIYGDRVHVFGNVVYRRLSADKKKTKQAVSFGWGPLTFHNETIRVNEKRPEYIDGVLNVRRDEDPGFIPGVKVWVFGGALGETPAKDQDWTGVEAPDIDLVYGLNRTAYAWIQADANEDITSISGIEVDVSRDPLFVAGGDYQTPVPSAISTAFPSGIPSNNPIAASLDYVLNTDYGAAKDPVDFDDFTTWISAINRCAAIIDVVRTGFVSWSHITKATASSDGLLLTAKGADLFWDSEAFSLTGIKGGQDGLVVIKAKAFSVFVEQVSVKSCQEVEKFDPNFAVNGGGTYWQTGGLYTVLECTTTVTPTNRYEGVMIGLDSADQGQNTDNRPIITHAIHLRTDGKYEIWENGSRIRANSGQGGLSDPLDSGINIGYDGGGGFDSEWVFGTYSVDDEFSIGYSGGNVIYRKAAATVYTSLLSTTGDLKIDVSMWRSNALAEIVSVPGNEEEPRFKIGLEVGKSDDDTHMDVIEELMMIANAALFQSNGILKCFIAEVKSSSATLDRSNFAPKGSSTTDIMDIPNVVEVEFREDRDDGEKKTAIFENPAGFDVYGEIRESIEMHGIPERIQASRMASYRGRRAFSEVLAIAGTADQKFFNLEPGDIVEATMGFEDVTWFSNKKFWIDNIIPENADGDVDLELLEYGGDSLFDDSAANTIDQNDPILAEDPTIRLPDPSSTPLPPTNVQAVSVVDTTQATRTIKISVTWDAPDEPDYMHDKFLIYRRTDPMDPWVHIDTVSGKATGWIDAAVDLIENSYLYAVVSQTSQTSLSVLPDQFDAWIQALRFDNPPKVDMITTELLADSRVQIRWEYDNFPLDFDRFGVFVRPSDTPAALVEPEFGGVTQRGTKTDSANVPDDYIITVLVRDLYDNFSEPETANFTMPLPNAPLTFSIETLEDGRYKLAWTISKPLNVNFEGVQIRYLTGTDETWELATPLHDGTLTGIDYTAGWLPTGTVILLISTFDTAGNRNPTTARIVASIADPATENALEEFNFKTGAFLDPDDDWPLGSLVGGAIVTTDLKADSLGGDMYPGADVDDFYNVNPATPMYDESFGKMIYTTPVINPSNNGRMTIENTITATTFTIEFKGESDILFFDDDDPGTFFDKTDPEIFFDPDEWQIWPGSIEAISGEDYEFRITTEAGTPRGTVEQFIVNVDVPDIIEELDDVDIGSSGTRLSLTKTFAVIKTVHLTLQDDSGSAETAKVMDKSVSLGPLIETYDSSSVKTTGRVDARVVGY